MNKITVEYNHNLPVEIERELILGDFELTDDWIIISKDEYDYLKETALEKYQDGVFISWDEYDELLNYKYYNHAYDEEQESEQ